MAQQIRVLIDHAEDQDWFITLISGTPQQPVTPDPVLFEHLYTLVGVHIYTCTHMFVHAYTHTQ